jgi:GNAT superfamily N-acetyltransferase
MNIKETNHNDESFRIDMFPFFASRAVRRELGIALSSEDSYVWFIAYIDDVVAGFAALDVKGTELRHAYIVPEHRGKGIYTQLLDARLKKARELGLHTLKCVAAPDSVAILQKAGFAESGNRGKYTIMTMVL